MAKVAVVVEVMVVALVVVIVLVAEAVVKSCPGLVNTNWGP